MDIKETVDKLPEFRLKGDKVLWICVMFFAMISVVAVFSSSTFISNKAGISKTAVFMSQIKIVAAGFLVLFICYLIPMKIWRRFSFLIPLLTTVGLLAALLFGENVNGAQRGLKIGGSTIQVLEFAKLGLVIYLAKAMEVWQDSLDTWKDYILKLLLPIGGTCLLVLPNSASTVVLFGLLSFMIMWFMGIRTKYLLATIGAAVAALALVVLIYNVGFAGKQSAPGEEKGAVAKFFNRIGTAQTRVLSFVGGSGEAEEEVNLSKAEMEKMRDAKRQSENAKIAISSGKIFGKGPGKSTQRYSLSMAFSDFIFASIVEEYGLLGGGFVIFLYLVVLIRSIRITKRCSTPYSEAIILGIAWLIALQAMLHIFVNVRLMPITGHTLPLISHGGTAYIVFSAAMGIVLSVSRQLEKQQVTIIEDEQD